jgi:hypothetical protein
MVEPTYTIAPDPPRGFLHLTLAGNWNAEMTGRFVADVNATLRQMLATGVRHGELRTLVDMRHKNILPQDAVAEITRMVRPNSPSKCIALLIAGPLHRMQAKRLVDERYAIFNDEPPALAWLWADNAGGR